MMEPSLLIKGGMLVSDEYDCQKLDLLLEGNRIKKVGADLSPTESTRILHAEGLYVAPGFVNIHGHDDFYVVEQDQEFLKSICYQGVTTSVSGNCGISNYPVVGGHDMETDSYQGFLHYRKEYESFPSLEQFVLASRGRMTFNLIPLIGHGTIRIQANGFTPAISSSKMARMKELLAQFIAQGGYGISTGLMYMPGTFSKTQEIIDLINSLPDTTNLLYASHLRGYSDTFLDSVQEAIDIARATGIKVECSHLGPFGTQYKNELYKALEMIEAACAEGLEVGFDTLAYCGGSTTIMAIVPPWFYTEGIDEFLKQLRDDDAFFSDVVNTMESYVPSWPSWEGHGWTDNFVHCLGWEHLVVLSCHNPLYRGKSLADIARQLDCPVGQAFRKVIIEEEGRAVMLMQGVGTCLDEHHGDMSAFDAMVEHPEGTIAIDAIFNKGGRTMPYAFGTFPKVVKRYVKERKTLSLQDAIRKFTIQPLEKFGITDRGHLREGAMADLVVFDLDGMEDNHDTDSGEPTLASGVKHLIINGNFVIENEEFDPGMRSGEVLLRTGKRHS
jgi:N-acyl-D-amino-acid deacylase